MTAVAQQARVARAVDFAVADLIVTVGEIEGTVQLIVTRDGWQPGRNRDVLCNEFADAGVPAQLRALADHLDGIYGVRA